MAHPFLLAQYSGAPTTSAKKPVSATMKVGAGVLAFAALFYFAAGSEGRESKKRRAARGAEFKDQYEADRQMVLEKVRKLPTFGQRLEAYGPMLRKVDAETRRRFGVDYVNFGEYARYTYPGDET